MNFLNMSQDEIDQSGAHWTTHEIAQQPQVWLKAQRSMARDASATRAFLEPLLRRSELQIVLTGAGTSACIGEILAPALTRQLGMRVQAIATTDLAAAPDTSLAAAPPVLLVSFARSGNSPESVAALKLTEQVFAFGIKVTIARLASVASDNSPGWANKLFYPHGGAGEPSWHSAANFGNCRGIGQLVRGPRVGSSAQKTGRARGRARQSHPRMRRRGKRRHHCHPRQGDAQFEERDSNTLTPSISRRIRCAQFQTLRDALGPSGV